MTNKPYTPEHLREIAAKAKADYEEYSKTHGPGTVHDLRNKAWRVMREADSCARWMEAMGYSELANVGPFTSVNFTKGQKVRIRAGAKIRSLHPSRGGMIVITRARVVTLHDVYRGRCDAEGFHRTRASSNEEALQASVRQPEVVWAGTGGYWCHADLNDVEAIEATNAGVSPQTVSDPA